MLQIDVIRLTNAFQQSAWCLLKMETFNFIVWYQIVYSHCVDKYLCVCTGALNNREIIHWFSILGDLQTWCIWNEKWTTFASKLMHRIEAQKK